ncbi:hypothetical protein PMAYCL1PPCAC_11196, partial [Pristionchus mayeri]
MLSFHIFRNLIDSMKHYGFLPGSNPQPKMDILALPGVFLREIMTSMDITDRLSMRLTCRFAKLVAETNAGHFDRGQVYSYSVSNNNDYYTVIRLGDKAFKHIPSTE